MERSWVVSMFEHRSTRCKWSTIREGAFQWQVDDDNCEGSMMRMPPRPASVASSHPSQWDLKEQVLGRRLSLRTPPIKKGHKRQNCVRISNLPPLRTANRASILPQMTEEDEEEPETPITGNMKTPRLTLLETGEPVLSMRASLIDIKASPTPFQDLPILESTNRTERSSFTGISNYSSTGITKPDLDVFSNSHNDSTIPNIFAGAVWPHQWQLSPSPRDNIKLNSTPPALQEIGEYIDPDSPILPSPAYNSAKLFPRKSVMQGSRQLPMSGVSSRTASPSPTCSNHASSCTRNDLRRSVMMLRRMTSEGKLPDHDSRIYRGIGENNASSYSISASVNIPYSDSAS